MIRRSHDNNQNGKLDHIEKYNYHITDLLPDVFYVLFKLLDGYSDVDCTNVPLLELGIEDVYMWHDVVEEFQKERVLLFQQHGHGSCLSDGIGIKVTRVPDVVETLNEIFSVLEHSVDGLAVKVPPDIA